MIGIVVATHGNMGVELIKTAEMVRGECQNTEAVPLFPHESCEKLTLKIEQAISRLNQGDGVVILSDLIGGSCCTISGVFLRDENIEVLTGVNLPMIINLVNHRNEGKLRDVIATAQEAGIKSIVNLR
ncbi:PTS fructose transporter subunit IIA, partial [Candidatus Desantisbacteria bacterium]|nr:PTS fructose transporter subunit IIA [Candidatus Desantisbacteria bacterium]